MAVLDSIRRLVPDLGPVLARREIPTVTLWNRLEGRPRSDNFDRALKGEVRDALFLLTRQWQLGEFEASDAGSPIFTKVQLAVTQLAKYQAGAGPAEAFEEEVPLEAKVERRPLPLGLAGNEALLDVRLLAGRHWLKLVAPLGDFSAQFTALYPIAAPDPTRPEDAGICAHLGAWSDFAAVAGRRMDGVKLLQYLAGDPSRHAADGIPALAPQQAAVNALAARFVAWFARLFYQPAASGDAWVPAQLEYQFACSAPNPAGSPAGEKVLVADQYYQGHLDWYNFDVDTAAAPLAVPALPAPPPPAAPAPQTLIPTRVTFDGMPTTRWWEFEDGRTNFGDVKPDTTDLAKLLVLEFGLIYANDWFLIPHVLPGGSIARIRGLAVTNVFGERTWVEAAGSGRDDDWQRWAMFLLNARSDAGQPADTSLFLPPVAPKVHAGGPLDEVALLRDEVANMVWGVEKTIPLATGAAKPGAEAARETLAFFTADLARRTGGPPAPPPAAAGAAVRYQVMDSVPENWVPFIPVHVPGSNRTIQLQRAAMPRILDGDPNPPVKVQPRTALLREGLDQPSPAPYFVHEEEVPRAGASLSRSFYRTRWRDGRVWLWLGIRKQTGRGEGASGLAFDRILPVPPSPPG